MIVGFIVVGAFLAVGIWVIKDAGFFRWIWLGLNSLFAIGMIAGAVTSWRNRNRNRFVRVRGDRSGVHVEELRGRIPVREICIPRGDRIEVRSFNTGRVNNSAMVRIELIDNNQVVPLRKWYPEEAARQPIAELRAWLE